MFPGPEAFRASAVLCCKENLTSPAWVGDGWVGGKVVKEIGGEGRKYRQADDFDPAGGNAKTV